MVLKGYSPEFLSSVLNSFRDLVLLFDGEGLIVDHLQDGTSALLYLHPKEFIGRHHSDVLPPDLSRKVQQALTALRDGEDTYAFDYRLSLKGKPSWFTAVFSPVTGTDADRPIYLCVIHDITERKEKEILLQSVLDNAFNAFLVLRAVQDATGSVCDFEWIMVNRKGEQLAGESNADLRHKLVKGTPGRPWILFDEYVRVAESGSTLDIEHSFISNGKKVWLQTHASAMEDKLFVTIRDITDKKDAEQKLRDATEQLRLSQMGMDMFFTQALSGFFFMTLDKPINWEEASDKEALIDYAFRHMRITRVNEALLQQYGGLEEEFINVRLIDFFRGDLEQGKKLLAELFTAGRIHINRPSRRNDGSIIWLEGNYISFTDNLNRILGIFGIQHDVTDRKKSMEALRASEERYRLLADNLLDMVAIVEPEGGYTYVSPSVIKLLGYLPEELIGTSPYSIIHPGDIPRMREHSYLKAMAGEEVSDIQYRARKKDGAYIWLSTNTKPIVDRNGTVTALQTISRNVTERIQTMQQLEELNHQKNKLFTIIAHDLRGPLASCMGLLNLTQKASSPEELQKYLRMARKSAFNLHELMEDLLLWAASQLNRVSFDPAMLNIHEEIEAVTRRFTEAAEAKAISLTLDAFDDSLTVYADRDMFHTIVRNLLSNAIKFTAAHGKVTVSARREGDFIQICVADTGTGIKKENIDKLFSKTSNFSTFGTAGEKGTGLGLDICKDFVEKHGGSIRVESEEGKGSRFIFVLKEL